MDSVELATDGKPAAGVIPITVEQLSSADSDDSCDKTFNDKQVNHDVMITASSAVVSSAGGDSSGANSHPKLLLLQMASMYVEAADASQQTTTNVEQTVGGTYV